MSIVHKTSTINGTKQSSWVAEWLHRQKMENPVPHLPLECSQIDKTLPKTSKGAPKRKMEAGEQDIDSNAQVSKKVERSEM